MSPRVIVYFPPTRKNPVETMDDEIVTIVDNDNNVVGAEKRSLMRRDGLPHRATYVLVFNSRGQVFVHKRTDTKDVFPGYYDVVAGGVVLSEESYAECARRELQEELGIKGVPLRELFDFAFSDDHSQVFGRAYACTWDGPLELQLEEIAGGEFHPVPEVLESGDRERYTPDGFYVLQRYVREHGSESG
jgi:8-oxo-dGTP pyrophosphatase MutT (NUDIX family)